MSGGGYTLIGTAGQSDAGPAPSRGDYSLSGCFWSGSGNAVYLPLVLRCGYRSRNLIAEHLLPSPRTLRLS